MPRLHHFLTLCTILLQGLLGTRTLRAEVGVGRIGAVTTVTHTGGERRLPARFETFPLEGGGIDIGFDLLGSEEPLLAYRVLHCDAQWRPSQLQPIEYIGGFDRYDLPAPEPSRGTLQPYVHYELSLPNDQTQFKRSGNYLVEIYEVGAEHDPPLLTIPIGISESLTRATAEVKSQTWREAQGRYQQVEIDLAAQPLGVSRIQQEVEIVVLQNGRWDNAQRLHQPSNHTYDQISYRGHSGAIFDSGNEYHKLEHLTDRSGGMGVERVWVEDGLNAIGLYPQRQRALEAYVYEEDRNGREFIRSLHTDSPDTEADYHWVLFTYTSPRLSGGGIILEGACVSHLPLQQRTLVYDDLERAYRLALPLKMGYQEYQFLFLADGATAMSSNETEGNHYQTTNDYTILVYLRTPIDRADRLVAVTHVSS